MLTTTYWKHCSYVPTQPQELVARRAQNFSSVQSQIALYYTNTVHFAIEQMGQLAMLSKNRFLRLFRYKQKHLYLRNQAAALKIVAK